jgi:hypothetical protein
MTSGLRHIATEPASLCHIKYIKSMEKKKNNPAVPRSSAKSAGHNSDSVRHNTRAASQTSNCNVCRLINYRRAVQTVIVCRQIRTMTLLSECHLKRRTTVSVKLAMSVAAGLSKSNFVIFIGAKNVVRRTSEWEILEGLKDGQRFDKKPKPCEGYLHKKRKWPLKGWHKVVIELPNVRSETHLWWNRDTSWWTREYSSMPKGLEK